MAKKEHDDEADDPVDMGTTPSEDRSLSSLEEKYGEQMRQIFPTRIDLPWLNLKTQIDEHIDIRPEFQRRDWWSNEKRSRFIESVAMNVPVPPVFLGEEEHGKYVVLDGRQRLTAALKFLSNKLRLEGLQIWKELNGCTYADLKKQGFAAAIERRFLPAILLTHESSPEVKYEVFDRLNTGEGIAAPMEVRNSIFPGPFNAMLHELSVDHTFRKLWGIPDSSDPAVLEKNVLYREMGDLELILRFFALRPGTLNGMRFKDRLSDVMNTQNAAFIKDPSLGETARAVFRQATANCAAVFGDDAFRLRKDTEKKAHRSAPYADAVMHALAGHSTAALTPEVSEGIRAAFENLYSGNSIFRVAVENGTNGETAIKNRISLARSAVDAVLGREPHAATSRESSQKKQ